MATTGVDEIENIISKCDNLLKLLDEAGKSPNNSKVHKRRFSVKEAAILVGRGRSSLHRAHKEGNVPEPEKDPTTNRTLGYTLKQINQLRDYFNTRPGRNRNGNSGGQCVKIAIQSFKGGVAKSVTSVHLAQYLAIQGYSVLIVDCDPQASATSTFGYLPDNYFSASDTLLPYFQGEQETLDYCVRETYFDGISLIPSCLAFSDAEYHLAFSAAAATSLEEKRGYFNELRDGLKTIENNFDVIVLDSPPALGLSTINILTAADALVVPTPPAMYDFSSTVQYFKMIHKVMTQISPDKCYAFIKILVTRADLRKSMHSDFLNFMRETFGQNIFHAVFHQTAEIENCAAQFKTVYDEKKPQTRALQILESVFSEIEQEIVKLWPKTRDTADTDEELMEIT